jgi:hypothetical protein
VTTINLNLTFSSTGPETTVTCNVTIDPPDPAPAGAGIPEDVFDAMTEGPASAEAIRADIDALLDQDEKDLRTLAGVTQLPGDGRIWVAPLGSVFGEPTGPDGFAPVGYTASTPHYCGASWISDGDFTVCDREAGHAGAHRSSVDDMTWVAGQPATDDDPAAVCPADVLGFACTLPPGHDGSHVSTGTTEVDDALVDHVVIAPPGAGTSEGDIAAETFTPDVTPAEDGDQVEAWGGPIERGGSQMHEPPLDDTHRLTDRIVALLDAYPAEEWDPASVADVLGHPKVKNVGATMANLAAKNRLRRISPGVYQANERGPEPEPSTLEHADPPAADENAGGEGAAGTVLADGDPAPTPPATEPDDEPTVLEFAIPSPDAILGVPRQIVDVMLTGVPGARWHLDQLARQISDATNEQLLQALSRLKSDLYVVKVEQFTYVLRTRPVTA